MRRELAAAAAAFAAMSALTGFAPLAMIIFAVGCGLAALAVVTRRSIIGIVGFFWLCLLSPFAFEYNQVSDELTLLAVVALATVPAAVVLRLALTSDEKRRFEWRADARAALVAAGATLLVFHSILLLSLIGNLGEFIGDTENTAVQVLVLTLSTALVVTVLLVPPRDDATATLA